MEVYNSLQLNVYYLYIFLKKTKCTLIPDTGYMLGGSS